VLTIIAELLKEHLAKKQNPLVAKVNTHIMLKYKNNTIFIM